MTDIVLYILGFVSGFLIGTIGSFGVVFLWNWREDVKARR